MSQHPPVVCTRSGVETTDEEAGSWCSALLSLAAASPHSACCCLLVFAWHAGPFPWPVFGSCIACVSSPCVP